MTLEDMARIHARAMVHSVAWGAPTLKGFVEARGALVIKAANGFALGRVIADEAELLTVAVDPDAQGKGIGRACLETFEREARQKGAKRVFLEVSEQNVPAIRLYLSSGYIETGRRADYYTAPNGQKTDAIMMSKPLVSA